MLAALAIFSRVPLPGSTKSRLAGELNQAECALFHRACLADLHRMAINTGIKTYIYITGGDREDFYGFPGPVPPGCAELQRLKLDYFDFRCQCGSNLGERLVRAAGELLQLHRPVIIIGSDLPYLDGDLLLDARNKLENHDLVLGPAVDGGYYLMGLKREHPGLFSNIDWGTELVLQQTLAAAIKENLSVAMLPVLRDIDTWDDLAAFLRLGKEHPYLQALSSYRLASYLA